MNTTEGGTSLDMQKPAVDVPYRSRGFTGYCGLEFTELSDEKCVISCPLRPELLNPMGVVHGGLTATLTDVAAGTMALQADRSERKIVTQSCNIHYLRPGTGARLRAESTLIRKGRRVCVVRVDCYDDEDRLVACAVYEIAYLDA